MQDGEKRCKYFEWLDPEDSKHTKKDLRALIKENELLHNEKHLLIT